MAVQSQKTSEKQPQKIRIGFVGVGNMGQCAHLKNYATLPQCEVVAIAELRQKLAHKVAARYGVPKVYADHEAMLANEKLDAIVASQPFTRHGQLVPELLKAGVPVFTEKPIAGSIAMGEKIVQAVKASKTFMMIGYHKRSDPATAYAMQEIQMFKQSGELGALRYVRIVMPDGEWTAGGFCDIITADDPRPELQQDPPPTDMDAPTYDTYLGFVNYYIHQVNLMRHLLGESYSVKYADAAGVLLVGQSKSGVPCTIEMAPYQTTVDWQESALVCFERGWIRLELPAPLANNRPGRVEIYKDPGNGVTPQHVIPQLPWVHAMRQQAANFIRAVKGEISPVTTAAEALEDLKLAHEYTNLWKSGK